MTSSVTMTSGVLASTFELQTVSSESRVVEDTQTQVSPSRTSTLRRKFTLETRWWLICLPFGRYFVFKIASCTIDFASSCEDTSDEKSFLATVGYDADNWAIR